MARGKIVTEALSTEVNMLPRLYIEATERPSVLHTTVSVQQTNLLPENNSQTTPFCPRLIFTEVLSTEVNMLQRLYVYRGYR